MESLVKEKFPSIFIAGSAVILAIRYMPVAWKVAKQMYALLKGLEAVSAIPEQVNALMKEVRPNGGSSLRDAIDRASSKVDRLSLAVDELSATHYVRWKMAYGEASWHSDASGKCTAANHLLCDMVDANETDLIGNNWKNMIHPDEQRRVFSEWGRVVLEGAQFNIQTKYMSMNGDVIPVRLKANPIVCHDKVVGWIGTAHRI